MSGAGKHILLIEDDPDTRRATTRMPEAAEYESSCQPTGAAGPELAATLEHDASFAQIAIIMILAVGQTYGVGSTWLADTGSVAGDRFLDRSLEAETLPVAVSEVPEVRD